MDAIEKKARRRIKRFIGGGKAHRVRQVSKTNIYRYVVKHSDSGQDLVFRVITDGRLYKVNSR